MSWLEELRTKLTELHIPYQCDEVYEVIWDKTWSFQMDGEFYVITMIKAPSIPKYRTYELEFNKAYKRLLRFYFEDDVGI